MSKNEPFAPWQCPLCGEKLTGDSTLKCTKGHCFDRAKEGYWHLLPVQSMRTKAPGDSKEMVAARRAFLNAGYYGIFGKAVGELCAEYGQPASPEAALHLLDAGCGEGWYDRCIAQALAEKGRRVQLAGFDIAKPAVRLAAKALPTAQYAVASSFRASNSATFSNRNSTSGWEKSALEPVVKSVRRVPMPITKSAWGASWLAASPPVTPTPPRLSGWSLTSAPFPACVSANGSCSVSTNSRNASCSETARYPPGFK